MESYAEERLRLGRASLYRYLGPDWVLQSHKEWLEPHRKGFIPDLSDATNLMWIEHELTRKDLTAQSRAELEALRTKALEVGCRTRNFRIGAIKRSAPATKG